MHWQQNMVQHAVEVKLFGVKNSLTDVGTLVTQNRSAQGRVDPI